MKFEEKEWPVQNAIKTTKGDGRFHLAVFADPECPWCKRFVNETYSKLNDVTVYWFICPVLGDASKVKGAAILGSKDPAKAWLEWEDKEVNPTGHVKAADVKILDENVALSEKLGVETVPAVFLKNGEGPFGFMTALELISKIEQYD
ncbi:MAG: DsbC family protein [Burkholderiales bacterium]|nr:DsbC family protein [Burkholderiales bacterium]